MLGRLFNKLTGTSNHQRLKFYEVGYHGDKYLLELVDFLFQQDAKYFIETGSNVGSTLVYTAKKFPNVICLSCEPDERAFLQASQNASACDKVTIYPETSQAFLKILNNKHQASFEEASIFWIDAHGYGFDWPLREEINFIMSHYKAYMILIDDFLVPHLDCFLYDVYKEHICSFDYIESSIPKNANYRVIYPNYTEHTSRHHPLKGWGLITNVKLNIPEHIKNFITNERKTHSSQSVDEM